MIGPNVTRLMWIFLIGNIGLAIANALTDHVSRGIFNGICASLLAVTIAVQADRKREQR